MLAKLAFIAGDSMPRKSFRQRWERQKKYFSALRGLQGAEGRGGALMIAAKRTMPVGLWARLMVRLWLTTMRLRIARLLVWLVKTLRL